MNGSGDCCCANGDGERATGKNGAGTIIGCAGMIEKAPTGIFVLKSTGAHGDGSIAASSKFAGDIGRLGGKASLMRVT